MRSIYSAKLSKRGQFFILSAVIIASIIVSLASVKNYVATGDAPKKFYYYSQQLEEETGAVVDFALYNDPSGADTQVKNNLNNFLQYGVGKTLEAYPDMEIFSCYTNSSVSNSLICQNNGTRSVKVEVLPAFLILSGTKEVVKDRGGNPLSSVGSFDIAGKSSVIVTPNGSKSYNIDIQNSSVQRGQFYFVLRMNTTAGNFQYDSTGTKQI